MTRKATTKLSLVEEDIAASEAMLAESAQQAAPMVQRLATHRDRMDLALKELESERFELISRRDLVRRQAEAVEQGLTMHIEDIDATMRLYEAGLHASPLPVGD